MSNSTAVTLPRTPYGEFLAEHEEIQRLKWLASERVGHDIGFEFALSEWSSAHRAKWREMRNQMKTDLGTSG
jgi:hypothetical protein